MEKNQPNPPQQYSPVPSLPCEQTPRQPTPSPSCTQWSEDLLRCKQQNIPLLISTIYSSELTLPPFVEPSQPNESPIPGPSQPSKPHEDTSTCEHEPEVVPIQSTEEPFFNSPLNFFYSPQLSFTPPLHISSFSPYTCLRNHHQEYTHQIPPSTPTPEIPTASSPIPMMRLGRNLWTCNRHS
ncbi:hypothetical protein O181_018526 [Austropuccinia psidii MF-1]|uniref:Uncharacterized protein n=1 Tax=Austropuccinia psidii MF-1 TaxID=1389203 RepID=A0A9Q3GT13_9BASI|nr:hypothetical protein [Austropuccinia psidii MF-1]